MHGPSFVLQFPKVELSTEHPGTRRGPTDHLKISGSYQNHGFLNSSSLGPESQNVASLCLCGLGGP